MSSWKNREGLNSFKLFIYLPVRCWNPEVYQVTSVFRCFTDILPAIYVYMGT